MPFLSIRRSASSGHGTACAAGALNELRRKSTAEASLPRGRFQICRGLPTASREYRNGNDGGICAPAAYFRRSARGIRGSASVIGTAYRDPRLLTVGRERTLLYWCQPGGKILPPQWAIEMLGRLVALRKKGVLRD